MDKKEEKGLNTYVTNNCYVHMPSKRYKGLRIDISSSAMRELINEGKTLYFGKFGRKR